MDDENALARSSRKLLARPEPGLQGRLYRALNARKVESSGLAPEDLLSELDPALLEEARRLGFEAFGVSSERGPYGIRYRALHMLDEDGIVELELNRSRNQKQGQTQYRMRAHLADGTTVAIEPEEHAPDRAPETPVFAQADTLRASYEFLRDAVSHHADDPGKRPVQLEAFEDAFELAKDYEVTELPGATLRRQIRQVLTIPSMIAVVVFVPLIVLFLLPLL